MFKTSNWPDSITNPRDSLSFASIGEKLLKRKFGGQIFNLRAPSLLKTLLAGPGPLMNRTLSEMTYSEGSIASGKCTGCGRVFTASTVAPLAFGHRPEWELVAAFGNHECTPAPMKSAI